MTNIRTGNVEFRRVRAERLYLVRSDLRTRERNYQFSMFNDQFSKKSESPSKILISRRALEYYVLFTTCLALYFCNQHPDVLHLALEYLLLTYLKNHSVVDRCIPVGFLIESLFLLVWDRTPACPAC